jgi:hypothetical protein
MFSPKIPLGPAQAGPFSLRCPRPGSGRKAPSRRPSLPLLSFRLARRDPSALVERVTFPQPKGARSALHQMRPLLDVFSQEQTWPRASGAFFFCAVHGRKSGANHRRGRATCPALNFPFVPPSTRPHWVERVIFPQPQGAPFALHQSRPLLDVFSQEQTWPRASGAFFFSERSTIDAFRQTRTQLSGRPCIADRRRRPAGRYRPFSHPPPPHRDRTARCG